MKSPRHRMRKQSGVVLVISLMLLVVITFLALSLIQDSTSSLQIVGNMEFQQSARAAAQAAIENVIATPSAFATRTPSPSSETLAGWSISVQPVLLGCPCGSGGGAVNSISAQQRFNLSFGITKACWDVIATVSDQATGTSMVVHQGVERQQSCPGS